jgi:hypothetical protein
MRKKIRIFKTCFAPPPKELNPAHIKNTFQKILPSLQLKVRKFPYICTVKYLALIFSFYFFALAVMPCSDKDDCTYQSSEQSPFSTTDHSDHDGDTENCSPFCMCACCGHSVTAPDFFVSLPSLVQYPSKNLSFYKASFVSGAFSKIWQPPKIS